MCVLPEVGEPPGRYGKVPDCLVVIAWSLVGKVRKAGRKISAARRTALFYLPNPIVCSAVQPGAHVASDEKSDQSPTLTLRDQMG